MSALLKITKLIAISFKASDYIFQSFFSIGVFDFICISLAVFPHVQNLIHAKLIIATKSLKKF